jgi:hypothetical protein
LQNLQGFVLLYIDVFTNIAFFIIMTKKLIAIAALVISLQAVAQQATITYNLDVQNSPAAAFISDLKATIYYKQGKSLADLSSSMFSTKTLVTDSGSLTLTTAMGQKFFVRTPAAAANNNKPMPDIIYLDSTKEIAGYQCKKAIIKNTGKDGTDSAVFWYTDKLPVVTFGMGADMFKGLKGMPLEYEMNTAAMKIKLTAEKVSTADIPDSTFILSTQGYTELDPNHLPGQ